jgi:hypothetical protein
MPNGASDAGFAIHPFDNATRTPSDRVYGVKAGGVVVSEDMGAHWEFVPTPGTGSVRIYNVFETGSGNILLEGMSPHHLTDPRGHPDLEAPIFVCDGSLNVLGRVQPGKSNWHGPRSIDEAGGTIIYAEYPENSAKYRPEFRAREQDFLHLCDDSAAFRSTDGGKTWTKVFEKSWREIRHFHTAMADPHQPGVWYLSSGDSPHECRMWRSSDDGLTWEEITARNLMAPLHPTMIGKEQAINRHTDMVILEDRLIWGTDDLLGSPKLFNDPLSTLSNRVGSRLIVSPKTLPLQPQACGFVGSHIRSIVDVGQAYLVMTEAKNPQVSTRPQVTLLTKEAPYFAVDLFSVDRHSQSGTGFTYSRASRAAKNGRFFTFRDSNDVFAGGCRILQWDIAFE